MRFSMLPEQIRRWILLCIAPACALSACTPPITIATPAAACSTLIPSSLRDKTPGAPMPSAATAGAWEAFAVQQTGQLDKSNADRAASIEIVEKCEARDAAARQATVKRKTLKL